MWRSGHPCGAHLYDLSISRLRGAMAKASTFPNNEDDGL